MCSYMRVFTVLYSEQSSQELTDVFRDVFQQGWEVVALAVEIEHFVTWCHEGVKASVG